MNKASCKKTTLSKAIVDVLASAVIHVVRSTLIENTKNDKMKKYEIDTYEMK